MAIDPTQFPGQIVHKFLEPFPDRVRSVDPGKPGNAAADFQALMDAPGRVGVAPADRAVSDRTVTAPRNAAGQSVSPADRTYALGDRVLANTPLLARQATALRQADPAQAVAARSSVDTGGIIDLLHTQAEIAQFRARVGLAAAGVQKSTQGVDTLLKSQ